MRFPTPKTVVAAVSVLAVLIAIQLAVVFTIFIRRAALISSVPTSETASMVIPLITKPDDSATRVARPAFPQKKAEPEKAVKPQTPSASTPPPTERETLVESARAAREKGDMTGALAGLREAQNQYPDDPLIVSEMALTFEKMGLVDKALNQWKRVVDAGEKAGDLYGIAAEKLKHGVALAPPAGARDEEGLQPGSTLGFADLKKAYAETPEGVENVSLQVAIKSRSAATISAGDVNTQMAFYDLINNQEVEPTTARVTWNWVTAPPDWQEDGIEVLKISYSKDPENPADPAEKPGDRKYLGYIVRVYYKNELQDVRAEPVKLLQYFPPQVTLQSEIPP